MRIYVSTTYLSISLILPLFRQESEKLDAKIWFNFFYDMKIIFNLSIN